MDCDESDEDGEAWNRIVATVGALMQIVLQKKLCTVEELENSITKFEAQIDQVEAEIRDEEDGE